LSRTNNLKKFLWENKEGIIIGGIIGYVVATRFLPSNFDISVVQQTQGVIDLVSSGTPIEIAKTKVTWAFTIIGSAIGMVMDMNLKEGWYKKWL